MLNNKLKPGEVVGNALPILEWQKKRIMQKCGFNTTLKNQWVQWATQNPNRTSLSNITQEQAKKIMVALEGSQTLTQDEPTAKKWGAFTSSNPKHRVVLSTLRQMRWVVTCEKHGEKADIERLGAFLMSNRSPVQKPLNEMNPQETEKLIKCLEAIFRKQPIKP